jgi:hypothetical protein
MSKLLIGFTLLFTGTAWAQLDLSGVWAPSFHEDHARSTPPPTFIAAPCACACGRNDTRRPRTWSRFENASARTSRTEPFGWMGATVLTSEGAILRAHLVPYGEAQRWLRQMLTPVTGVLWLLQGTLDFPLKKPTVVVALMDLGGGLAELASGEDRLPASPFELVNAFRVFVSGLTDAAARPLIDEAEQVCRRRTSDKAWLSLSPCLRFRA